MRLAWYGQIFFKVLRSSSSAASISLAAESQIKLQLLNAVGECPTSLHLYSQRFTHKSKQCRFELDIQVVVNRHVHSNEVLKMGPHVTLKGWPVGGPALYKPSDKDSFCRIPRAAGCFSAFRTYRDDVSVHLNGRTQLAVSSQQFLQHTLLSGRSRPRLAQTRPDDGARGCSSLASNSRNCPLWQPRTNWASKCTHIVAEPLLRENLRHQERRQKHKRRKVSICQLWPTVVCGFQTQRVAGLIRNASHHYVLPGFSRCASVNLGFTC